MVSVCLPSDALLQHLQSYLGFSYLGGGVSLHSCSSKAQLLLLTLDEGYLLTTAHPDLQLGIAPLGPPVPARAATAPWTWGCLSLSLIAFLVLKSGGCAGAGGLRGATPRSRSGGVVVRRYPSSKVRSSSCALLEQP